MTPNRLYPFFAAIIILAFAAMACGAVAQPTPTPLPPTATATTVPTNTATAVPTATPRPTATPNLAATQQFEGWQAELQNFSDKSYLAGTDGNIKSYDDFSQDWAQLGWYKWWPYTEIYSDFMFGGHLKWNSASNTPDVSGCGIIFGLQDNNDHYGVFLDKSRILFVMSRGSNVYTVGKTSGSGRTNFSIPAEADMQVLVQGQNAYVSVNGDITHYTLSADQTTSGGFALTLLSGTNRDYGTRCEMTNVHIWTPK